MATAASIHSLSRPASPSSQSNHVETEHAIIDKVSPPISQDARKVAGSAQGSFGDHTDAGTIQSPTQPTHGVAHVPSYSSPPRFQLTTPPRQSDGTPGATGSMEPASELVDGGVGLSPAHYTHFLNPPSTPSRLIPLDPNDVTTRHLWVRNLPYSFSWQDLKDLMRTACTKGSVLRSDVSLDAEGRSKGYGSVVFEVLEDAKVAALRFHGFDLNGRKIIIQPVRGGRAEQLTAEGRQLFVTNMPFTMRWPELKQLFRMAGNVQRADVLLNGEGESKGIGVVVFESKDEADRAIVSQKLNPSPIAPKAMFEGFNLDGRRLRVRPDKFGHLAFISNNQTATKSPG
ncbi:hypothetical protein HDU93_009102, partial [Gonapodya sp. JEL0774]